MVRQLHLGLKPEAHARLEDYVGEAAMKLASLNGLIYLSGAKGGGKSHLLQGLCRNTADAGGSAIYLPALHALDASVLKGLESVHLLCLDDIDQVIGQESWQIALFHLVNACRDRGNKLVMSGVEPVAALDASLADLASRMKSAYLVTTDELTDDEKLEVVRRKAQRLGFAISEEVCRFILSRSPRDMHHLARLVAQLDEETLMRQKKVTVPLVKDALGL